MRNYVDPHEHATFSSKGSYEDKFLGDWAKFMVRTESEKMVPNMATASNTIESMRILMRSRHGGVRLTLSAVCQGDQFRAAYLSTSGAGGENVSEALSLFSDSKFGEPKTVRVLIEQTRQLLADKN